MSQLSTKVITKRQAKAQINHFGRALVIYIALMALVRYGYQYSEPYVQEYLPNLDLDYIYLGLKAAAAVIAVIPFMISSGFLKLKVGDYLKSSKMKFGHLMVLSCIGISLYLLTMTVSTLFYFFFHTSTLEWEYFGLFNTQVNIIKNLVYAAVYVILEPICEEYIFRGIIQRQLGHYGRYFGVLGSAVLFAIAQNNLVDAVTGFVLGWYLSLIVLQHHSIRPAMFVHIVIHLFTWGLNVIPGGFLWLISIFIVIAFVLTALFLFEQKLDTSIVRYGATEWRLWKILLTSSTIILCIVMFIANVVFSLVA